MESGGTGEVLPAADVPGASREVRARLQAVRDSIDLNADLGEGYPTDEALLDLVTSASVACGFHAGDALVMLHTARSAASRGVVLGAHPSYEDREGFGRRDVSLSRDALVAIVGYQIGAMRAVARAAGTELRFVKPHGALYNRASVDEAVADAVAEAVTAAGDGALGLLCAPGSALADASTAAGLRCYLEAFADRAYRPDGTLLPRSEPGAVITDRDAAARQAVWLAREGTVVACDGSSLKIEADSICVHGDSPDAVGVATAVRAALEEAGVAVEPFFRD